MPGFHWRMFEKYGEMPYGVVYLMALELVLLFNIILLQSLLHVPVVPDLWFGYSYFDLHDLYKSMGPEGRNGYFIIEIYDYFPYMLGYKFLLGTLLYKAQTHIDRASPLVWMPFIPVMAWMSDMVENAAQMYLLCTWSSTEERKCCSDIFQILATVGSISCMSKWVLVGISVVAIPVLHMQPAAPVVVPPADKTAEQKKKE
jgi:hypothetical protein